MAITEARPTGRASLWGADYVAGSNIVDRHVRNLRLKLKDGGRNLLYLLAANAGRAVSRELRVKLGDEWRTPPIHRDGAWGRLPVQSPSGPEHRRQVKPRRK